MTTTPRARARLIVTIGPPGAGKTTWRHHHAPPSALIVSLDELRATFSRCGCSGDHRANPEAVAHGLQLTRDALAGDRTVVWDITAFRPYFRHNLLQVAAEHQARTVGVLFLPPVAVALARNATRDAQMCPDCRTARRVPADTIRAMHEAITTDLPRLHTEGWHTLHHQPPHSQEVA
ncbi:ATP-binding protein [Saccharomonospora sp. NPDC006951]